MPITLQPQNFTISALDGVLDSRAPTGQRPNRSPTIATIPAQTRTAGQTFLISAYGSDPDGDAVLWSRSGGTAPAGVTVTPTGSVAILTDVLPGQYTVQVQCSDGRGLSATATFDLTIEAPVITPSALIRFAPGHYIRPGLGDSLTSTQSKISSYDSRVRGVIGLRYWKDIEIARGVFDWSWHDGVADACEAAGKTYVFRVQDRVFGTTTPTGAVPSYLVTENLTYYRLLSTAASGAALWRSAAMSYNIALYKRILDRYGNRAGFVGIAGEESIYGQIESLFPDYSASGYITQEIRRMQELRAYAPRIPYWLYTNWITGDDASMTSMKAWFAAARADKGVFVNGGPDTVRARPPAGGSSSDGEDVLRGDVGGVNHRGVYLMLGSTENEEFSRGSTAAQIYAEAVTDRRANIMSWSTNPAQWLSDAYPYIATHPTVSTVPSAMTGLVEVL